MTKQTPIVGVLSPGDMGRSIGMVLQAHGVPTLTCLAGRSERTRALARRRRLRGHCLVGRTRSSGRHPAVRTGPGPSGWSRRRCRGRGPRHRCRPALRRLQRRVPEDRTGYRTDPGRCRSAVRRRRDRRSAAGGDWVQWLGDPLPCIRFRFGGLAALGSYGLDVRVVGPEVGQASGLKMCYGALTKGLQALGTELLVAAEMLGLAEALRIEQEESVPELLGWLRRLVPSMPP